MFTPKQKFEAIYNDNTATVEALNVREAQKLAAPVLGADYYHSVSIIPIDQTGQTVSTIPNVIDVPAVPVVHCTPAAIAA